MNKSNINKWDEWHKDISNNTQDSSYKYGDTETYQIAANFLSDCKTIEDWGVGAGGFLIYSPEAIGIDGSDTPFATKKFIDLCDYETKVEGIHIRHILEHNYEWDRILENALKSATKKICLTLFIPLNDGDTTIEKAHNLKHGVDVPDLSISKDKFDEILLKYNPSIVETITLETNTGYSTEIVYKITK